MSQNKNDECKELVKHSECIYYDRSRQLKGSKQLDGLWDIEDLVGLGKKVKGCPYYSVRLMVDEGESLLILVEIIFCPYNYIIDPSKAILI